MSSLSTRIAKLEQARARDRLSTAPPVIFITMPGEDDLNAYQVEHGGQTWKQEPGESFETFKDRATAAALASFKPVSPFQPLCLCADRPVKALATTAGEA